MKIIREYVKRQTLDQFSKKHQLIMEVHERSARPSSTQFYAHFQNSEIKDDSFLIGVYGDGSTEEEAIRNYGKEISGKLLVVNAHTDKRREIFVPIIVDGAE